MQGEKGERQAAGSPLGAGSSPVLSTASQKTLRVARLLETPESSTCAIWELILPGQRDHRSLGLQCSWEDSQLWALKHRGEPLADWLGWERGRVKRTSNQKLRTGGTGSAVKPVGWGPVVITVEGLG